MKTGRTFKSMEF